VRILIIILTIIVFSAKADHYYGGYITYKHIGGYKYKVTLITYADNDKVNSDRDSVEVIWGDGAKEFIQRVNNFGNGETVFPGIKKNIYQGTHNYSVFGNYQIVFVDEDRPKNVKNIEYGKSNHTMLYIDAIIPIEDSLIYCKNNSPLFLTEPYMKRLSGEDFVLSLTHYDPDGDSLVFKLKVPQAKNAYPVPGYDSFPDDVSIDSKTGLFKWENTPSMNRIEKYVFAYEIEEYREGQLIGVSIVDFFVRFDPSMSSKGDFTEVSGPLEDSHYHFDESEVINLMIEYENPHADSVFIDVFTGLHYNPHFRLTESISSNGNKASNNLEISYLGEDNSEGNHIVTYRAVNIFGSDTLFDFYSISLSTASDSSWSCNIPRDIRDVIEIAPMVANFTISPNLFMESVWVNLGNDYKNIKLEIFDMRGRIVGKFENSENQTFKLNLNNLRSGMYFFNFFRDEELIIVSKTVKK